MMMLDIAMRIRSHLDAAFEEFHRDNPKVYAKLVELARGLAARGHRKIGIGMLFEVVRWHHYMQTSDPVFKLNNNHRSRYARLIMRSEPDLSTIFDLRALTGSIRGIDDGE